jgi:hypothetical protein
MMWWSVEEASTVNIAGSISYRSSRPGVAGASPQPLASDLINTPGQSKI